MSTEYTQKRAYISADVRDGQIVYTDGSVEKIPYGIKIIPSDMFKTQELSFCRVA